MLAGSVACMRRASVALLVAAGILLAAAIFFSGGSTDGPLAWIGGGAIVAAGAAGAAALSGRLPVPELDRAGLLFLGLLAGFVVWNGISIAWSAAPDRSWNYFNRGLAYLAFAVLGLAVGAAVRRAPQDGRTRPRRADRRRLPVGTGREGDPCALRGLRTLCAPPLAGRLLERSRAPGRARSAPWALDRVPARARSPVAGRGRRPRVRARDRGRAHVLARRAAGSRLRDRRLPRLGARARGGHRGARHRRPGGSARARLGADPAGRRRRFPVQRGARGGWGLVRALRLPGRARCVRGRMVGCTAWCL